MPQLQKPMPVTAAPFRKVLRVVIGFLPRGWSKRRPAFQFLSEQIAKPRAIEQSYLIGIAAGLP